MTRITFFACLAMAATAAIAAPKSPAAVKVAAAPKAAPATRELQHRTVDVTDETAHIEIFVAVGVPTTIMLPLNVTRAAMMDAKGVFADEKQQRSGRFLIYLPEKDIAPGAEVPVVVSLEDGTQLPPITLKSSPTKTDSYVEVKLSLKAKAGADSATALRAQVVELQSRLDDCQQVAGDAGARKIGELILKQDFSKPVAFVAEHHSARKLDRQEALLVETRHVYRLFDLSYLVLTIENRDPSKPWVMDKAEISVSGGSSTVDAQVVQLIREVDELAPGAEARFVVVFKTPEQETSHSFTLRLREKSGNRHVELEGIKL